MGLFNKKKREPRVHPIVPRRVHVAAPIESVIAQLGEYSKLHSPKHAAELQPARPAEVPGEHGAALTDTRPDPRLWRIPDRGRVDEPPEGDWQRWSWDACVAVRAEPLAIPAGPPAVWLRTLVDVPGEVSDDA